MFLHHKGLEMDALSSAALVAVAVAVGAALLLGAGRWSRSSPFASSVADTHYEIGGEVEVLEWNASALGHPRAAQDFARAIAGRRLPALFRRYVGCSVILIASDVGQDL